MAVDNLFSQRHLDYYRQKAKGGTGLLVSEPLRVHPSSVTSGSVVIGYQARVVPTLRRIVDAVHLEGAAFFGQVLHCGRQEYSYRARLPLWAPSAISGYATHEVPHAMTVSEIAEVVDGYEVTARHVAEAGCDGIEVHAAHGYLLQQFMSPISNKRTDTYGGSLDNRLRIVREVVDAVRRGAPSLVVGIRVSGSEFTPGGLDIDDMCEISSLMVRELDLDYVSVSQSNYEGASFSTMIPDASYAPGSFAYLAREIKRAVAGAPVVAIGRINTPALAEQVLSETDVDMIAMNRATIADPDLPRLASAGQADRIRPCIALNVCWGGGALGRAFSCAVNPASGMEGEWGSGELVRPADRKRIVVIGAGPAGMEAALTAASGGHEVILLEQTDQIGGQLRLMARLPNRADVMAYVDWADRELQRMNVDTRLQVTADAELVLSLRPDGVIIATGSTPSVGALETASGTVITGREVLDQGLSNARVLVCDREWAWQAPSIAEYLHDRGVQVGIATEKLNLGLLLPANVLPSLYARLDERQIPVRTLTRVVDIANRSVTFEHPMTLRTWTESGFDSVVVAGESKANDRLLVELKEQIEHVHGVGDCVAPRQIIDATFEAHRAAVALHDSR